MNRQRRIRVRVAELETFLARARRELRLPAESLSICLVTDAQMAKWNRAYRGKNRPTDVLSFPADGARSSAIFSKAANSRQKFTTRTAALYLGDIAIAPAVAKRNARKYGRTLPEELRILILHGALHLMGYDHETDTSQMDRREQMLRRKLGLA
ncbi:MAG TPA: rRNA maturation RNase YbeY [Candidatus Limnocylindrales bacterium]|nr:rRNA maturation RNase YbeY [Candidatus Limnocylindrales bacterium]